MDTHTQPFQIPPELSARIEQLCAEYPGQLDDLYQATGVVVIGQLFGWRVMRLVTSRSTWQVATELFGDLKTVLPEYGVQAERSVGLRLTRELGDYWKVVRGLIKVPERKRRELSTS